MVKNGAEILIDALVEQGVDTIFGYPGGAVLNIYDALYKNSDRIRHILTAHEQGAAHAADGYARATGKVGVCLDTCHVSDGGYDIVHDLDGVLTEFDSIIGLRRLKAIHLNDSKNPPGSRKDRHACLGEGTIGLEALGRIVRHPALKDLPFCLETPNDLPGYAREIALMREMAEA